MALKNDILNKCYNYQLLFLAIIICLYSNLENFKIMWFIKSYNVIIQYVCMIIAPCYIIEIMMLMRIICIIFN